MLLQFVVDLKSPLSTATNGTATATTNKEGDSMGGTPMPRQRMAIAKPKIKRLEWARAVLIALSILGGLGILTWPIGFVLLLIVCACSIVVIGAQLVLEVQMRLLDLVLLTMAFGNIAGWTLGNSQGSWIHDEDRWLFGLSSIVLILGAFRNALITAQRLAIKNTIERLWLIVVYLLLPFAIIELLAFIFASIAGQYETVALLGFLGYPAAIIIIFADVYRRDMQKIQTLHHNV